MPTATNEKDPWSTYGVAQTGPNNWVGGDGSMEAAWAEPAHKYNDTFDASGQPVAGKTVYQPGYGAGADPNSVVRLAGQGGGYGGLGGGTMAGSYTGGGTGSGAGGGTGSGAGGYSLPDAAGASAAMRALQMQSMGGLQGLMNRDTTAQRKKVEDALFATSSRGINTAADRARQTMLEGTFARGVGSSSILTELAGRQQQEQSDALAQAGRDAFTQAGSEDRADLASLLGLNTAGFNAATSGLQGEANVALANLAREQQASQFSQNLGFQGTQNDLNRQQAAGQFAGNLGLQYSQLGQQANQFGQNLGFQGEQNQLNRDQQTAMSQAQMQQALAILAQQQGFSGAQSQLQRDWLAQQSATGQTFTGQQNQLSRDQQMQLALLQLANSRDIASGHDLTTGLGAGLQGVGNFLAPLLKQWGGG